ncbi:hypothetical protein MCEMSEM23_01947 [Rhabdaerophilaceae bacterium]
MQEAVAGVEESSAPFYLRPAAGDTKGQGAREHSSDVRHSLGHPALRVAQLLTACAPLAFNLKLSFGRKSDNYG